MATNSSTSPEAGDTTSAPQLDSVALERRQLEKGARLHWAHWAIVVASLVLTLLAWKYSKEQIERNERTRFEQEAMRIPALIKERLALYENALWGGVAAVHAGGDEVNLEEWHAFSESLRIEQRYPGINGIGVIDRLDSADREAYLARHRSERAAFRLFPEHDEPVSWPIRYIEPLALNEKAVGLDMSHETNRREGAERAMDTGRATITGPIVLVQDAEKTAGFLFYAPFYAGSGADESVEARRASIRGLVYAPFIVEKLMDGTLGRQSRDVAVAIRDGATTIYDEHIPEEPGFDPKPLYTQSVTLDLYGREWEFDVRSTRAYRGVATTGQPTMILAGGITIDALLFTIFVLLTRSNRKALDQVDRVTRKLKRRTQDLEKSNDELERFAFVASHDLKTPLRGIGDLCDYLEEDLEDYLEKPDANPDVARNLGRVRRQVDRMNALIKGVLDYSAVGTRERVIGRFDLDAFVAEVASDLAANEGQFVVQGEPTAFDTDALHLGQVIENLLSNALKYHHDRENARVEVRVSDRGKAYEIAVCDDGPGIDPRFHDRIFEVFQTLQSRDVVDSTGIGLAIVKKIVDEAGGEIRVESASGEGARFLVRWPKMEMTS